jgi:hypothetical protein
MRVCDDRLDGPMVFIKNANVVKGNGDLVWHVDDGSGGHSVMCPPSRLLTNSTFANAPRTGSCSPRRADDRYAKHWITGRRR